LVVDASTRENADHARERKACANPSRPVAGGAYTGFADV
jgi:hypothetical protein